MMLMLLSVTVAPGIDVFNKLAGQHVPPVEVAFFRFLVQALLLLPFVALRGSLKQSFFGNPALHMFRGFLLSLGMIAFATALQAMDVADAIAIFFVEPAMLTILGGIFLKETIGWRRYLACATGFIGALFIIQPNFENVGWVALLPVVTAACVAIFLLISRHLSAVEDPWSMQLQSGIWGGLFTLLIMALIILADFQPWIPSVPEGKVWFYLVGTGVMATISSLLGVASMRYAPASTLAPLQYMEIVSATIMVWFVFGNVLDGFKWLGVGIIVASGLFIIWRERQLKLEAKPLNVSNAP
ncbi:MAG: hypothetical protein RIR97_997 [Pseudomonadota bacterium]|jgi:S-adenosylmethionine uptake transporter